MKPMEKHSRPDKLPVTLGVEEEFFLVDPESRDLLADPDPRIFEFCAGNCGPHGVTREFLRSQIETGTNVSTSVSGLRKALLETRRTVIEGAELYGVVVMAASMHPFAAWQKQEITQRVRYEQFEQTFQDTVRRSALSGMHIHAGFADADTRVRIMTAMRRYLPLFHALSGSSPFAEGRETGFKSWRLTLMGGLPRTGMPPVLDNYAQFERIVTQYRQRDFIRDGSELWWDMRPSHAYPTLEMRVCDVCTRLEDALAIAALYICLIRFLVRLEKDGAITDEPPAEIIAEDRWIAQRYGVFSHFGGFGRGRTDIGDCLAGLVEDLAADAVELGCEAELRHTLAIVRDGTGADRQLDLYRLCRLGGDSHDRALRRVVDAVLEETRDGVAG